MSKSVSFNLLKENVFTHLFNGQTYDESGNSLVISQEHSNILANKFKEGFIVLGFKNFLIREVTYFFLHNPITKVSEFGYINNITEIDQQEDTLNENCTNCNKISKKLSKPLEEIEQVPHQEYTTLLEDSCNNCLSLDINFPIKTIEIKEENIGTVLFFTDGKNEPRYIDLDNLSQYLFEGQEICDQNNETPTCLDCDKLRVFKLYTYPQTLSYGRVLGGKLQKGVYEVAFAYTDETGNELSSYTILTNTISIFDENNVIQSDDSESSSETSFGIKVELTDLDTNFTHYKLVLISTITGQTQIFKDKGIFSTSENIIFISNNEGETLTSNSIIVPKLSVQSFDGITASNNILFGYGVREQEVPNLQPVINLLGGALKWTSSIAKENLYENSDSNQYKGYNRDEVVPISIEFISNDGFKFPLYPLISRPATQFELEEVDNKDTQSINNVGNDCDNTIRNKRWQFYNTAEVESNCLIEDIPITQQLEFVQTYTEIEIPSIPAGQITINTFDIVDFVDVENYIEDNQFTCDEPPYDNSPIQNICQYIDLDNLTIYNNEPTLEDNCTNLELLTEEVQVVEIINETREETNKELVNYARLRPFDVCQIQDTQTPDQTFSEQYSLRFRQANDGSAQAEGSLYKRVNITYADTPQLALELVIVKQDFIQNYVAPPSVFPYLGAEIPSGAVTIEDMVANVVETKNALYTDTYTNSEIGGLYEIGQDPVPSLIGGDAEADLFNAAGIFTDKIHKGAIWYKVDVREKDFLLLEISRLLEPNNTTFRLDSLIPYFRNKYVRFHVFATPYDQDPIEFTSYEDENGLVTNIPVGGIFSLSSTPDLIPIDKDIIDQSIDGYIYLVADLPLSQAKGLGTDSFVGDPDNPPIIDTVITIAPGSCFSVNAREIELAKIDIFYDEIKLKKIQQYSSQCLFDVPILDDCKPQPYKKGKFAYVESTEKYPDNKELFDSSQLEIELNDIPDSYKTDFEQFYTSSNNGNSYTLNTETEFYCKPIRHFRFPDNIVSPFMSFTQQGTNSESVIYPLGISIDTEVVNSFLDIAVKNNFLAQKRRDSIIGFKIHRGDITLDRSIESSGLLYDLRKYTDSSNDIIHYSNFPYNSRGIDKLTTNNVGSLEETNYLFTAHTPELDYYKPNPSTEISVQGFQFGKSSGVFTEVEDHPKWVILGRKARSLANTLAILEVSAEAVIQAAMASSNAQVWAIAGVSTGLSTGAPAFIAAGVIAAFSAVSAVVFKVGRYRYEWLRTFRDLGSPKNFAYYYTSIGKYNYILPIREQENTLRRLSIRKNIKDGFFSTQDNQTGEVIKINSIDREWSTLISTSSDYDLEFPIQYVNYDNNDTVPNISSQAISSEIGCEIGKSREFNRNITSPYVAFKNYIPNQYGDINSIRWIDTNKFISLQDNTDCNLILGGDTFICRHSIKRKTPLFSTDAFDQADLTSFDYGKYSNFGKARYFIDYEITSEFNSGGRFFPDLDYVLNTDCGTSTSSFYFNPPSKFYLYYYGQPSFLTETRINTNYRYAKPDPKEQFYPQNQDYITLTQEKNVSIRERNRFYYNTNYSYQGTPFTYTTLPDNYKKETYNKLIYNPNSVIYSVQDNNENSTSEPWLVFRPLDRYTFPTNYGKLQRLKGIESNQVLGLFENTSVIFNAVDGFVDGITVNNTELGSGGIFARRPKTFSDSDLGYIGSQSHQILSCEYGHFIVDAKRGQIFRINLNAQGMEEISKYSGGKPNHMDVWFKEHLPFKILRDFPEFLDQIDNPYNGVGITMGWDSKFKRVFITKKDYRKANSQVSISYNKLTNTFTKDSLEYTLQELIQNGDLKEVSWTISYKPESGSWESFFSFKPNYYINHADYFQTGINQSSDTNEFGLWSHLLNYTSKLVFYGKRQPFTVEYPIVNKYQSKKLESIGLWTVAKRIQNKYDYSVVDNFTFNKAVVYNERESSGNLELIVNNGVLSQLSKYPKKTKDGQEILITYDDNKFNFNYFYNRVKSNFNNISLFTYDENQINKEVNKQALTYTGKKVLERMTGNMFLVRLTQDKSSQYDLELHWSENIETPEL